MASGSFRFERFSLDPDDRRLWRDDAPLAVNARYLDALALLVREHGRLVPKDRFLEEVWRGVPVTDEALTQCIRTLRRLLGDDAGRPRFIETVPKHGYRFVAPVEWVEHHPSSAAARPPPAPATWRPLLRLGGAGALGGGAAGVLGGLFYGLAATPGPLQPGVGAMSALLVLVCLTVLVGLVGGAGVASGIALAGLVRGRPSLISVAGGALGGLTVGAGVKLVALDAFSLLLGQSPGDITGAPEGALLGGAIGLAAWLADRASAGASVRRGMMTAALAGALAGALVSLLGGRLLGGSLDLLSHRFPGSHLTLDGIGSVFGEQGFGRVSQTVTAALEAALFSAGVVGAMVLARHAPDRSWPLRSPPAEDVKKV